MAMLVTRGEWWLSTPNNRDTVVFGNLSANAATAWWYATSVWVRQLFTPSKSGNVSQVGFGVHNATNVNRNLRTRLQENLWTATTPIASPWVVTLNSHWLSDNDEVMFTTTWTLPTGLIADTLYYVINATLNTFQVSLTVWWVARNFTGTTTWTHTLYTTRESKLLTADEINCNKNLARPDLWHKYWWTFYHGTTWWTYPITAVADKWSLVFLQEWWTLGNYSLIWINSTTRCCFVAINDPQTLASTWDTIIVAHKTEIDWSYTFAWTITPWDTAVWIAVLVLSNKSSPNPDDVFLRYTNYTWPHTITLQWAISCASQSWVLFGTSDNPIPANKQLSITYWTPSIWTTLSMFRPFKYSTAIYWYDWMAYYQMYSEYPILWSTLSEPALTAQNTIKVVGNVTIDRTDGKAWQIWDLLSVAWEWADVWTNIWAYGWYGPIAISNMVFDWTNTTITLASNLTWLNRIWPSGNLIWWIVQNVTRSKFWCVLYDNRTVAGAYCYFNWPDVLKLNWIFFDNVGSISVNKVTVYFASEFASKHEFKNVAMFSSTYLLWQWYHQNVIMSKWFRYENVWCWKFCFCYAPFIVNATTLKSWFIEVVDCYNTYRYNYYYFAASASQKLYIRNLYSQNWRNVAHWMYISWKKQDIDNIQFFRLNSSTTTWQLAFNTVVW